MRWNWTSPLTCSRRCTREACRARPHNSYIHHQLFLNCTVTRDMQREQTQWHKHVREALWVQDNGHGLNQCCNRRGGGGGIPLLTRLDHQVGLVASPRINQAGRPLGNEGVIQTSLEPRQGRLPIVIYPPVLRLGSCDHTWLQPMHVLISSARPAAALSTNSGSARNGLEVIRDMRVGRRKEGVVALPRHADHVGVPSCYDILPDLSSQMKCSQLSRGLWHSTHKQRNVSVGSGRAVLPQSFAWSEYKPREEMVL